MIDLQQKSQMISQSAIHKQLDFRKVYSNSSTMDPHLVELKSSLPSCSSSVSSISTSGLESLHGSSEEMSETSDYQRSTPSPRDQDDDLFMAHLINRNKSKTNSSNFHEDLVECESPKDLGFVDTVVKKKKKKKYFNQFLESSPNNELTPTKNQNGTKCSFSPKSFYKINRQTSNDLNCRKRSSTEKCSELPKKLAKRSEPVIQIPIRKLSRGQSGAGSIKTSMCLDPIVTNLIHTDPKLSHKALVKISKLPQDSLKSHASFKTPNSSVRNTSSKNNSAINTSSAKYSANNEALNSVTERMVHARVSPLKISPEKHKTAWKFGPTANSNQTLPSTVTLSTTTPSPSKLLRPAILNVTTPQKLEIKQEARCNTFTNGTSKLSLSSNNPFLPTEMFRKTSFLFGGDSDFQSADFFDNEDIGNILYIDGDEDDDDDDSSSDVPSLSQNHSSSTSLSSNQHIFGSGLTDGQCTDSKDDLRSFLFNTFATANKPDPKPIIETVQTKSEPVNFETTTPEVNVCNKLRFPVVQGSNNLIPCKWRDCNMSFTTYGNLSDHLKAAHVIGQMTSTLTKRDDFELTEESYRCLWDGCKVFDMFSSSRSWLEKHVPTHGGKFAYSCIVSGCKMRFSTQKMLQRHVNQHFAPHERGDLHKKKMSRQQNSSNFDPYHNLIARKKVEHTNQSESTKNLRRAGVKLKFRKSVFSARNFDFFDDGIMAGVKHAIYDLERIAETEFGLKNDTLKFSGTIVARRTTNNKETDVLVEWTPNNLLENEWIPLSQFGAKVEKKVKFCQLPNSAKLQIAENLMKKQRQGETEEPRIQVQNNLFQFEPIRPSRKSYNHSAQKSTPAYSLPPKGLF